VHTEVTEFFLLFSKESFVFHLAVQKYKGQDIYNYNFAFCFAWVWKLVSHSERGT